MVEMALTAGLRARRAAQFARFALVGASNTALTWLIFFVLVGLAKAPPVGANAVAWTLTVCWSFFWNRRFTFRRSGSGASREAPRFLAVNLSSAAFSTAIVAALQHRPLILAQAVATSVTMAWNFLLFRYLVFRAPTAPSAPPGEEG